MPVAREPCRAWGRGVIGMPGHWGEARTTLHPFPLPGLYFPAHRGHFPGCQPSTPHAVSAITGGCFGKAGTRGCQGWSLPPPHCPCLRRFASSWGRGPRGLSCPAWGSFHSACFVSGENAGLSPRHPGSSSPLLAASGVWVPLDCFHFPFQAFRSGTGCCAGSGTGSVPFRGILK